MRTFRRSIPGRAIIALAMIGAGLVASVTAVPAASASQEPLLSSFRCADAPARFFQLRSGDATQGYSELWLSSMVNPASANPTFYEWRKIQTFTGIKPVSIAAKEIKESTNTTSPGFVSYLYYSGTDDQLHQVRYAPNEGTSWQDRTLTTTGQFGYKALAWDGRLWAVKGDPADGKGDLYALTGLSSDAAEDIWAAPTGASLVKDQFGYPKSFYGVTSGSHELGYAEQTGELRYGDAANTFSESTVRLTSWNAGRTVDLGGGLLYRFLGGSTNEIRRYTIGAIEGSSTGLSPAQTLETGVVAADTPTTTVSDLCTSKAVAAPPPAGSSAVVAIAERYVGGWGGEACRDWNSKYATTGDNTSVHGQCKQFVNCVAKLAGQNAPYGGYYNAYVNAGYVRVSAAESLAGDIVQLYHVTNTETFYSGMHTAILRQTLGTDLVGSVVDSNYVAFERVGVHTWDVGARLSSHPSLRLAIWRWNP